ncbi:MAG: AI-2E family transporter [Ginsengibacter sp.]
MQNDKTQPFLVKAFLVLFCLLATGFIIWIGQDIIVPIAFATLLAILLLPFNNFLEKKLSRVWAISMSLTISLIVLIGLIYFFSIHVSNFVDDLPKIKSQLNRHLRTVQTWAYNQFHLTRVEQKQYIDKATSQIQGKDGGGFLGQTLITITNSIIFLVLLPIYTFLILYYRNMIRKFLENIFADDHREHVIAVIHESKLIVQGYMAGLLIEMGIITLVNYAGFLIIGIKYAFFLALLSAILNMIPYIGMLIALIICMLVTLTTSNNISDIGWIVLVLAVVQFFDNNIIMPKIVSSRVKINALITIFGVLGGGAIAGVSGMFLSIPVIAIIKVIFDRIEPLKPWGEILGDDITYIEKGKILKIAKGRLKRRQQLIAK